MALSYLNGPGVVQGIIDPQLQHDECETILHKLSLGNVMTKFSMKKKIEQRTFSVSLFV